MGVGKKEDNCGGREELKKKRLRGKRQRVRSLGFGWWED